MDRNNCGNLTQMMNQVAIDGPAASGKTTIGKRLAENLHYVFLDTGLMYRAATWLAKNNSISLENEDAITQKISEAQIHLTINNGSQRIIVNSKDITDILHTTAINKLVSNVSKIKGVRDSLIQQQREIAKSDSIVMVGRDIGTVVLPDATFKFFLLASLEVRAQRRLREMLLKDVNVNLKDVLEEIQNRDKLDSERELSPLKPAEESICINTDSLTIEGVVTDILQIIKA